MAFSSRKLESVMAGAAQHGSRNRKLRDLILTKCLQQKEQTEGREKAI